MNSLIIPLLYVLAGLIVFAVNFGKQVFSPESAVEPMEEWSEEKKATVREKKAQISGGKQVIGPLIDFSKWGQNNEK